MGNAERGTHQGTRDAHTPVTVWTAAALLGQLGLVVSIPIIGGVALGAWGMRHWGGGPWMVVVGIVLGIALGAYGAVRIVLREIPWNR